MTRDIAPNVFDACKIAECLNTTVEYLVTGIENNEYKTKYENLKKSMQNILNEN